MESRGGQVDSHEVEEAGHRERVEETRDATVRRCFIQRMKSARTFLQEKEKGVRAHHHSWKRQISWWKIHKKIGSEPKNENKRFSCILRGREVRQKWDADGDIEG